MTKTEMEGRDRLHCCSERLLRLIDHHAPACILANDVSMIIDAAMLCCGDDLFKNLGRKMAANVRRSMAICQNCDAPIPVVLSHHPLCEHCDAKEEEAVNRFVDDVS